MISNLIFANSEQRSTALKDTDLVYTQCSDAFARDLGFASAAMLLGKTDLDLFDSDTALEQLKIETTLVLDNQSDVSPLQRYFPDAKAENKLIMRKPSFSSSGEVDGLQLSIIKSEKKMEVVDDDITTEQPLESTDHYQMLDQLTTSHSDIKITRKPTSADFKLLIDSMPNAVVIYRGIELLYANRVSAIMMGYASAIELLRLGSIDKLVRGGDWDDKKKLIEQHNIRRLQSQMATSLELQGIAANGETRVLNAQAQSITWLGEDAVMLSFLDTTEQSLTAQLLSESEQRFKHYAEASADFFWEMDAELCFTYLSEPAETTLGIPIKSLIGKSSQDLSNNIKPEDEQDNWTEQLDRLLHHQSFSDFIFKWLHSDGSVRVIRYSGVPLFDRNGAFKGYRGTGSDVTSSYSRLEADTYYASHDSLTGLVNRRKFEGDAREVIKSVADDSQTHALCFLDLDNFKVVNDTCGHEAGDELLRQLAALFKKQVRRSDVLARTGGDEFAILLYNCGVNEALRLANQVRSEVEAFKFPWEDNSFSVGVSTGLVLIDQRWKNIEALFRAADSACYMAKDSGRNRVVVYHEKETPKSVRQGETHWVDQINSAIENESIKLSTQCIKPLSEDKAQYFEILMRLQTHSGSFINPHSFLPAAERYGLATKLDDAVLTKTLQWLKQYPQLLDDLGLCSINLTGQSFANEVFVDNVLNKIQNSGVPPSKLCFELSETATISNLTCATQFMHRLHHLGCQFSLDNFGSGLSSFAYLKNLPVDYLKIDGVIVRRILDDAVEYAMVKSINEIGQTMGRKIIATHVENPHLLASVKAIGVDFAQGFHLGQPEIQDI